MIKNPILKWWYKIWDNFIKEPNPYTKMHMFLVFGLIALDMIFLFSGIKLRLVIVYGTLNLVYWILNIFKMYYVSIKKPSE